MGLHPAWAGRDGEIGAGLARRFRLGAGEQSIAAGHRWPMALA